MGYKIKTLDKYKSDKRALRRRPSETLDLQLNVWMIVDSETALEEELHAN